VEVGAQVDTRHAEHLKAQVEEQVVNDAVKVGKIQNWIEDFEQT
jgi:hypothetical protein